MRAAKASFVLMRITVALCLFIAGIIFILVSVDTAIRLAQGNLRSWGEHFANILSETGESVAIGGAMPLSCAMVAWPRRCAWFLGSKMAVSLIERHQATTTRTLIMRLPSVQFSVRRMMAVVPVAAVIVSVSVSLLTAAEAAKHGHYACAFNQRRQELADRAGLVGSPESDVVRILGRPTSLRRHWSEWHRNGRPAPGAYINTTYNYAPCSFLPCGVFQVRCVGGVVKSTEQLDD